MSNQHCHTAIFFINVNECMNVSMNFQLKFSVKMKLYAAMNNCSWLKKIAKPILSRTVININSRFYRNDLFSVHYLDQSKAVTEQFHNAMHHERLI